MTYLERLLSRALAVPRAAPDTLFDPFAQVADWAVEPPAVVRAAAERTAARGAAEAVKPVPGPVSGPDAVVLPPAVALPPPPVSVAETLRPGVPTVPDVGRVGAEDAPGAAAARALEPDRHFPETATPLSIADAFMRSLAEPLRPLVPPEGAESVARRTPERGLEPEAPEGARPAPPAMAKRLDAVAPPAVRPAAVLPLSPPAPAREAEGERRAAKPEAREAERPVRAARSKASAAASSSPARGAVPARLARVAARREELAHSVNILRFGLGQS